MILRFMFKTIIKQENSVLSFIVLFNNDKIYILNLLFHSKKDSSEGNYFPKLIIFPLHYIHMKKSKKVDNYSEFKYI